MISLIYTFAATQVSPGSLPNKSGVGQDDLKTVLDIVLGIIGALAFLMIVVSGLRYVLAAGDPQKTANARNSIIFSLVGLALAIMAQAIVAFVVNRT